MPVTFVSGIYLLLFRLESTKISTLVLLCYVLVLYRYVPLDVHIL